jgi:tetratricopeptide (TPR) repeat protein
LAHVLLNRKLPAKALAEYEQALKLKQSVVAGLPADSPHNVPWKRSLALCHAAVGEAHNRLEDSKAALAAFKQSLSVIEPLVEPGSDDTETKQAHLHLLMLSGNALRANGDEAEAEKLVRYGVAVAERVVAQHSTSILLRRRKAALTQVLADILSKKGDYDQAMQNYMAFVDVYRQLSQNDTPNTSYANSLYFGLIKVGETAVLLKDRERGAEAFEEAIAGYEHLIAKQPDNNRWKEILGWGYDGRAELHRDAGEPDLAIAIRRKQLAMFEAAKDSAGIAKAHGDIGDLQADAEQLTDALQSLGKCRDMRRALYKESQTVTVQRGLASVLGRLSLVKRRLGDLAGAYADARESHELRTAVLAAKPDDANRKAAVAETLVHLAEIAACRGEADETAKHFEAARDHYTSALATTDKSSWKAAVDHISAALADPVSVRAKCPATALAE